MANETLSPNQAKQIANQFEMIINQTVTDVKSGLSDFFVDMQKEWEDKYAVDLAEKLKVAMEEVTKHLQENSEAFVKTVEEIAKAYATTGGMAPVSLPMPQVPLWQLVHNIKDTFDGDMFGFKNVESHDRIATAIETLVKKLQSTISETASRIKSINAFGNPDVIANLSISGGKVVQILQEAVEQVKNSTKSNLQLAAEAYIKTGKSAADAANIKTS